MADHDLPAPDVTGVEGSVGGYVTYEPTTARAALEPVLDLFGINAFERGEQLVLSDEARLRTAPVEITDLVSEGEEAVLEIERQPQSDLPREIELNFRDPFTDYQASVARYERFPDAGDQRRMLVFPGTLESGQAQALIEEWIERRWRARERISFALPMQLEEITPGTSVMLPERRGDDVYLVEGVETGRQARVTARAVGRRAPAPWRHGEDAAAAMPAPEIPGPAYFVLLDLPSVSSGVPSVDQFKVAARAKPWRAQALSVSPDGSGFEPRALVRGRATIGHVRDAVLAAPSPGLIDRSGHLDIDLLDGSLESVTRLQLFAGANVAALGAAGGWEVFQFETASEVAPARWRLTGLLRGQLGTDDLAARDVPAGTPFVLLDRQVIAAGLERSEVGLSLQWRCAPAGYDASSLYAANIEHVGGLRALKPLAPVHLRRMRQADGGIRFEWIRRGRLDADSWLAAEIPLGEAEERYVVELQDAAGAVLRSAETDRPSWIYPFADRQANLGTGAGTVTLVVAQISMETGPGVAARCTFALAG